MIQLLAVFFGYYSPRVTTTFGTRGRIEFNDPDLCFVTIGSSYGYSAAWVMLGAKSATHPNMTAANAWAQVGYIRTAPAAAIPDAPTGMHYFAQYTRKCKVQNNCTNGDTVQTVFLGSPRPTAAVYYDVYLRAADDRIHMYADGINLVANGMPYDPTGVWDSKWQCTFAEETFAEADDAPGTINDKTGFNYLQRYLQNGSRSNVETLTAKDPDDARYSLGPTSVGTYGGLIFNAWTDIP